MTERNSAAACAGLRVCGHVASGVSRSLGDAPGGGQRVKTSSAPRVRGGHPRTRRPVDALPEARHSGCKLHIKAFLITLLCDLPVASAGYVHGNYKISHIQHIAHTCFITKCRTLSCKCVLLKLLLHDCAFMGSGFASCVRSQISG